MCVMRNEKEGHGGAWTSCVSRANQGAPLTGQGRARLGGRWWPIGRWLTRGVVDQ